MEDKKFQILDEEVRQWYFEAKNKFDNISKCGLADYVENYLNDMPLLFSLVETLLERISG
ncbi:MAG: hypothetical protein AABY07_01120 [Nanoarchaeota archaeon]